MKFRAGWGKVGNVDLYNLPNPTSIPLSIYPDGSLIGGTTHYGTYLATIPNTDARWETTVQTSAGLDLTMLHNTLEVSVDYYNKETKDLVDYLTIPPYPIGTAPHKASSTTMSGALSRPTKVM